MYRKSDSHRHTAAISDDGVVTMMYDEGWSDIIDCVHEFKSTKEARDWLLSIGYEEYDPNAELKALGFVWKDGMYRMP